MRKPAKILLRISECKDVKQWSSYSILQRKRNLNNRSGIPDPRPDCVELHQPRFSPRQVVEHSPHTDCRTY
ncbi:unnamed protein product [Larinioides sclopetarius]|uniref:Uncharacterized protein n=1 Tax=Larinioides sclopetarius TaxID=280406 RepID=A0AAV1ZKD5_9ARAC